MTPHITSGTEDIRTAVVRYPEAVPSRPTPHTGQARTSEVMPRMVDTSH
jgi:hypothetical protein